MVGVQVLDFVNINHFVIVDTMTKYFVVVRIRKDFDLMEVVIVVIITFYNIFLQLIWANFSMFVKHQLYLHYRTSIEIGSSEHLSS